MEILAKWIKHQSKIEEEKVLNIVLRVLENIKEWEKITPYNLQIKELDNGDVTIELCQEIDEKILDAHASYSGGVKKVAEAKAKQATEALDGKSDWGERISAVSLLYYLLAWEKFEEGKKSPFDLWKTTIRNGGEIKLPDEVKGTDDNKKDYEYVGSLMKRIQQGALDNKKIIKDIIEKYPPQYKIEFYSYITKNKLQDMDAIKVKYEGTAKDRKAVVIKEENEKETEEGKLPEFQICFNKMLLPQQLDKYHLVEKEIIQSYMVSTKELDCKCYLCPKNWEDWTKKNGKGQGEDNGCGLDDNTLQPREKAEVLEAYFDAYQEFKRYLLIYADRGADGKGHCVIAYFDNKLLKRNRIRQWEYQEGELEKQLPDEIHYMRLKNEEIDSICIAASDKEVEEKLIGIIWNLYDGDSENKKDIRFTQNCRIFSKPEKYLKKMQSQLYRYYDLCFWSKDAGGRNVCHGIMKKMEPMEYEFSCQMESADCKEILLVFYYTVDMDGCTFSYSKGKRKAFSVSVALEQYQGKLIVKCTRDEKGKYKIFVYTDQGKELKAGMEYG